MYLVFPNYNFYSVTLLLLVLQGVIFAALLLKRYFSEKHLSDLFLSLLLFSTGYHTTTYIIGFMDWYDTYQNTKINYWLINFIFATGPLIYFYVKSLTQPYFKFRKKDFWHFVPALVFFVYKVFMFIYDASQPGFDEVQNGWFNENIHSVYVYQWIDILHPISMAVYSFLAVKIYLDYRKTIVTFFSNTYQVELNWIRNFLIAFIALFVFELVISLTDYSFFNNYWQQRWWGYLAGAMTMLYVGMMSYFSDLSKIHNLQAPEMEPSVEKISEEKIKKEEENLSPKVIAFFEKNHPYLNPDLTLADLAKAMQMSSNQLSQIINSSFNKNFNEFINGYRVEAFKSKVGQAEFQHLSLLGVAMECGFNSKATFNRVFKKITGQSPSEFARQM